MTCDDPVPQGSEFHVNTTVEQNQQVPSIAMDSDGDFVVVWMTRGFPAVVTEYPIRISAQRFNAAGEAQASEFRVDNLELGPEAPAVAMDAAGNFVVVWQSFDDDGNDGAIWARLYDSTGTPASGQFQVNQAGSDGGAVQDADVAMDADGDFVVVWRHASSGPDQNIIRARRFDETATPLADEVAVATSSPGQLTKPAVATDQAGNYTVAWLRDAGFFNELHAQRYDASGAALGDPFVVGSSEGSGYGINSADVAIDADGDTVFAWSHTEVKFRRYDETGVAQGDAVSVGQPGMGIASPDSDTALAIDADGDFVVGWSGAHAYAGTDPTLEAFARRYSSDGSPVGAVFRANTQTPGQQRQPTAAMDGAGNFAFAWISSDQEPDPCPPEGGPQCSPGTGIYSQRFAPPGTLGEADVAISISDSPDPVHINNSLNYTVTVSNLDEADPAVCVTSEFTLPEGAGFAGVHGPWSCTGTGPVSCDLIGSITPGASQSYILRAVAPGATVELTAMASVAIVQTDPSLTNNSDTETTNVNDPVPDQFTFVDLVGKTSGTEYPSNLVTISGIDTTSDVTIQGGRYSKNGGAFTTSPGTVVAGDTLRVRLFSSPDANTTTNATLTVGGISDTFSVTTGGTDTTAAPYTFTDQVDVPPATARTSNPITVTGINAPAAISIVGGRYRINGIGSYVSTPGTVNLGDSIRVLHTSASTPLTAVNTTLNIGGTQDTFTSTTNTDDVNPDAFGFGPTLKNQAVSTLVESIIITPIGYDAAAPVKALAGTEYSINGGGYTAAAGTINPGDTLRVRHVTASTANTVRKTGIKIGTTTGYFFTRTASAPE